jgi:hypothetical protein
MQQAIVRQAASLQGAPATDMGSLGTWFKPAR